MKRGDIYIVSLDPTEGHEQQGTRPVLIVSTESFNHLTKLPIILPITTGGSFARIHGFAVSCLVLEPARWPSCVATSLGQSICSPEKHDT